MESIAVHLAEGFEEIEAISIIDVLRRADFKVITVSVTGNLTVTGSHEIPVVADELFENVNFDSIDMIVLPGGMPGAKNLNNHSGLKKQILEFNKNGKHLGAICAAPLVFGLSGILEGKNATCYPGFEENLEGALITEQPTVVDGNITTGKGAGVAIQFALKIVEELRGAEAAAELAKKMIVQ
ncbi:DJ-1 family glyoxalase III [Maribellus maritimus]|uniref:DJ-1 family glyoxalase III n=1 Tax=Maribellus maritimus TaxID=2870838 RepID=UPI001EEA9D83|nr:DJ-1 family glyoxalase III [Maribellus maritimus]MCG6188480.1 DJ-1/PfpI family protein [Maribellus maritimus]